MTALEGSNNLIVYANDSVGNIGSSTVVFSVSIPVATPVSSGGGGTRPIKFKVLPSEFSKELIVNIKGEDSITITNQEKNKETFKVKVLTLNNLVRLPQKDITLAGGASNTLPILIDASNSPGVYNGVISVVARDGTTKETKFILNIESEQKLFDVTLSIPEIRQKIRIDENLQVKIELVELGNTGVPINTTIHYTITDFYGRTYLTQSENIEVIDRIILNKEFELAGIKYGGEYLLGVSLEYPDGTAVANASFMVEKKSMLLHIVIFVILVILLVYIISKIKKEGGFTYLNKKFKELFSGINENNLNKFNKEPNFLNKTSRATDSFPLNI